MSSDEKIPNEETSAPQAEVIHDDAGLRNSSPRQQSTILPRDSNSFWDYGIPSRPSRDASTNTPGDKIHTEAEEVSELPYDAQQETQVIRSLVSWHGRALDGLPMVRKMFFCVPLRYAVYTILASEVVFFSLRAYTRVLHLAMPGFYPLLRFWMAITGLILCLLILASDVFLLFGIFFNPVYIFVWIDLHLLQMLVYTFLIVYLAITNSECVLVCPIIYSAFFIFFLYFVMIVNTFRKLWTPPAPSDTAIQAIEII